MLILKSVGVQGRGHLQRRERAAKPRRGQGACVPFHRVGYQARALGQDSPSVRVFQFNSFPQRSFRVCLRYYSSLRLLQVFCDEAAKTARAGDVMAVAEPLVAALVAKLQVRPVFMHVYLPALFAFAAVWAAG